MEVIGTDRREAVGKHVVVVGAGMVGLATAWFLQEEGVSVTVVDRSHVAAGSSWGNAGWLSPALTLPLTDPAILSTGIRAVLSRSSPVYVPLTASPRLLKFLILFARNCTPSRFHNAMRLFVDVNREALGAYEQLSSSGVDAPVRSAEPLIAAFANSADRKVLTEEFKHVGEAGGEVHFDLVSGDEARALEPALGPAVECATLLHGQRFINPGQFVAALAAGVRERGGTICDGARVTSVAPDGGGVRVRLESGQDLTADATVLANGAWLGELARPFGVKTVVQAGRGYSFAVAPDSLPTHPIYLPTQRVACTPLGDGFRVAGMMEFKKPDAAFDPRRIETIIDAARPMLTGIDWTVRTDEWVGSRPCTPDGIPVIGRTKSPNIYVAGGHGMWGVALGPLTGRLIARLVAKNENSPLLKDFDPLR
ncbi:MAG: FAD-dependent oxidoreductase [Jatrophihabitans sp.]